MGLGESPPLCSGFQSDQIISGTRPCAGRTIRVDSLGGKEKPISGSGKPNTPHPPCKLLALRSCCQSTTDTQHERHHRTAHTHSKTQHNTDDGNDTKWAPRNNNYIVTDTRETTCTHATTPLCAFHRRRTINLFAPPTTTSRLL